MPQGQFVAGWFTPLEGNLPPLAQPPAGGIGGRPPVTKPPLPPGVVDPTPPIEPPPEGGEPEQPIFIPEEPTHPIQLPPGFVWPPFDPGDALQGKVLLLCWIPGVHKFKWVVIDVPPLPGWPPPGWQPPAGGIGGVPPPRPTPR